MESIRSVARTASAVRWALEHGEFTRLDTASEGITDDFWSLPSAADFSSSGPQVFPIRAPGGDHS
jgi:hypothetical protein